MVQFTLLTGISGQAWRAAVHSLRCPCLRIVVIGEDADAQDPYNVWHAASEIAEAGALLVRPDGYIAWRVRDPVWTAQQATDLLSNALNDLGLSF